MQYYLMSILVLHTSVTWNILEQTRILTRLKMKSVEETRRKTKVTLG